MVIFKSSAQLSRFLEKKSLSGEQIGFVPTMGALHEGHIRLVQQAAAENSLAVCSIFVNPTQFNDPGDFEKYPSTLDRDIQLLVPAGCFVLFVPGTGDIYPAGMEKLPSYDLGYLENILEGKYRPGHFQGVCQVVDRLLQIVRPNRLYMGRKDYQQCMVVKKLLLLNGMHTDLITCDTVREMDGLAMSSRNLRLDPRQREKAASIYRVLEMIRAEVSEGVLEPLKQKGRTALQDEGFRVDYVEICRADDLMPQEEWDGSTPLVALVAAYLGEVRLIDNMQVSF
jgi:pantoate--beta-alanine ligase